MSTSAARCRIALLAVLALQPVACHYAAAPVQLQASPSDIESLAGRWEGTFSSVQSGRTGNIVFAITAGKDTAYGDVLMIAEQNKWSTPITAADVATGEHARHSSSSELLRISIVRVRAGFVEGALEPYIAPDCHCTVSTTFRGTVQANSISGDYLTMGAYGLRQTGEWRVTRQPPRQEIAK